MLSADRIEYAIASSSGWHTEASSFGREGLAQMSPEVWAEYAPAGALPDDPEAAIVAVAAQMCAVGDELRDQWRSGDLTIRGWSPPAGDEDETELAGLVWAGVLAGPGYVEDQAGIDVGNPLIGSDVHGMLNA